MPISKPLRLLLFPALAILGAAILLIWSARNEARTALEAQPDEVLEEAQFVADLQAPVALQPVAERERSSAVEVAPKGEREEQEAALEPKLATVTLRVTRLDTGQPVTDCAVRWRLRDFGSREVLEIESKRTDEEGQCSVQVPTGVPLHFEAGGERWEEGRELGEASAEIEALRAEEGTVIDLALPAGIDTEFWAKVVDEQTGEPIEGARVFSGEDLPADFAQSPRRGEPLTTSDGEGMLRLPRASWASAVVYVLEKEGYGTVIFQSDNEHADSSRPVALPLRKSARLSAQVFDRGTAGAGPGAEIRWTTDSYELAVPDGVFLMVVDPVWRAELAPDGRAEITLPSRIPLRADLVRSGQSESVGLPLTLEPGESRSVEWRVGGRGPVRGTLVDQEGSPVREKEVWITRRTLSGDAREGSALFYSSDGDNAQDKARTDEQGRFSFSDVPAGWWWVGPESDRMSGKLTSSSVAPLATGFFIESGGRYDIEVSTWRGLMIRGRVLGPSGEPAGRESITANGVEVGGFLLAMSDADGSFQIGPCCPGDFLLRAGGFGKFAGSEPVTVKDGSVDVVLRLREAGSLRGTVVDGVSGDPTTADVWVSQRGAGIRHGSHAGDDGVFTSDGLEPGIYDLAARTSDGRAGALSDVVVDPGGETDSAQIVLSKGARVTVRYTGPATYANFTIFSGEVPVAFDGIHTGTSATHTAPAGALRVVVNLRRGVEKSVEIDVAQGEVREVLFEF